MVSGNKNTNLNVLDMGARMVIEQTENLDWKSSFAESVIRTYVLENDLFQCT